MLRTDWTPHRLELPGEKCLRHGTFMMFFFLDGEQLGLHLIASVRKGTGCSTSALADIHTSSRNFRNDPGRLSIRVLLAFRRNHKVGIPRWGMLPQLVVAMSKATRSFSATICAIAGSGLVLGGVKGHLLTAMRQGTGIPS